MSYDYTEDLFELEASPEYGHFEDESPKDNQEVE